MLIYPVSIIMHSRIITQVTIMSSIVSQSIITRRILGQRMHRLGATISAELETFGNMFRKYRVRCADYNVYLYIYENGRVHAELWTYGRLAVSASTLAGFISLLKNCKRWSEGAK